MINFDSYYYSKYNNSINSYLYHIKLIKNDIYFINIFSLFSKLESKKKFGFHPPYQLVGMKHFAIVIHLHLNNKIIKVKKQEKLLY